MSKGINVWEPKRPVQLDAEKLRHLVAVMQGADHGNLAAALSGEEISAEAGLMTQPEAVWSVAGELDDVDIESLIRFFTLAEMQLPGWEAGSKSPVIYLVRILKQRDSFTAELRKWIKANTDNRYLPYGSVL